MVDFQSGVHVSACNSGQSSWLPIYIEVTSINLRHQLLLWTEWRTSNTPYTSDLEHYQHYGKGLGLCSARTLWLQSSVNRFQAFSMTWAEDSFIIILLPTESNTKKKKKKKKKCGYTFMPRMVFEHERPRFERSYSVPSCRCDYYFIRGLSPRANYTDRAADAGRRS